jgi:nitrate reductase cytochrome c-type subunit
MKRILRPVLLLTALFSLTLLSHVYAQEQPESDLADLAADARQAPGDPPVIPHAVKPDQDGEACNICHRNGIKNAPVTSHPERLNCTSCHVQGEVKPAKKPAGKGKKK